MSSGRLSLVVNVVGVIMLALGVWTLAYAAPPIPLDNPPGPLQPPEEILAFLSHRSGWVPNVGNLYYTEYYGEYLGEQPLGDMWTFECPPGGWFELFVDTKDDTDYDGGMSCLNPIAQVFNPDGEFIQPFCCQKQECSYASVCAGLYACPLLAGPCAPRRGKTSIVVRDEWAPPSYELCSKGGGYELWLLVVDGRGRPISPTRVGLGGGAKRSVPPWAIGEGKAPVHPALDDENVPLWPVWCEDASPCF